MSRKNSNDTIKNGTRVHPACSAVCFILRQIWLGILIQGHWDGDTGYTRDKQEAAQLVVLVPCILEVYSFRMLATALLKSMQHSLVPILGCTAIVYCKLAHCLDHLASGFNSGPNNLHTLLRPGKAHSRTFL